MSNTKTFNSSKKSSRKSAFTLIELSIVLIIIGLLVAGVTGGASLIRSAQLRGVMSEARGYNVAVNAFRVQYDNLPGDYGTEIGASSFGNQNGKINFVDAQSATVTSMEGVIAFHQLINSGILDDTLTAVTFTLTTSGGTPPLEIGTNIPNSKLDGVGWVFDTSSHGIGNVIIATGGPIPALAVDTPSSSTVTPVRAFGAITPADALSIDTKLDDGIADNGRVRGSFRRARSTDCFRATNGAVPGYYETARTTPDCALEFTVDIS